jgi:hypothetical protein
MGRGGSRDFRMAGRCRMGEVHFRRVGGWRVRRRLIGGLDLGER